MLIFLFAFFLFAGVSIWYSFTRSKTIIQNRKKVITLTSQFSLDKAPKESVIGNITALQGDVSWQSRTATAAVSLYRPIQIQQGEMLATQQGGYVAVSFPSVADISLQPLSKLEIVQTLGSDAVFSQKQGEILYSKTGRTPVSVRSLNALIVLDNGKMNVEIGKTESFITISVLNGAATLAYNEYDFKSNVITISEGKVAVFDSQTRTITRY